ncbi:MAG: CDP-alcohol phosphatidyltransferase family protein [Actinomycetota bacterium]|nr:CDP-alcohol phosphatidyltransferase family protein [Acidimicrobiia bacterium]MDQ3294779.1 CDP-alcohol phosphatidyltransferase family protein [Actinomycetota bacterium]
MTQVDTTFGPSALATPANAVSIMRLLVTVPFLGFIADDGASWPIVGLWIVLCVTDGIDGWLARRQGTTRSGAFLDPLADKVLVLGALWTLVGIGRFAVLPVLLITARELGIQGLRSYYGRLGLAVPATQLAKVKTVVQEVAVGLALLPLSVLDRPVVADTVLWLAVALTLVTGVQYLVDGRRATRTGGSRDERPARLS